MKKKEWKRYLTELNIKTIQNAIKLLEDYKVRKPYKVYFSIYRKRLSRALDNLNCHKEIAGTTVIYDVEKILRRF